MSANKLDTFLDSLFLYLLKKKRPHNTNIIKKHTENFNKFGDFSFPNTVPAWHDYIDHDSKNMNKTFIECVGTNIEELIENSKTWCFSISKIVVTGNRLHIFLNKPKAVKNGITDAYRHHSEMLQHLENICENIFIDPLCELNKDLTYFRLICLSKIIQNLCKLSCEKFTNKDKLFLTSKSTSKPPECTMLILSGAVINIKTGSKETITMDELIRLRQEEMFSIAKHKYGVRIDGDRKSSNLLSNLGRSAATFEMLQVKPTSPVKINLECSSAGSSKGVAFILYNCARLETLFHTYFQKVDAGVYPNLPPLQDTDFSLLTHEDEWNLVFNYVIGLPSIIDKAIGFTNKQIEVRPHLICNFLCSMVRTISQYYRKVRILVQPREHLLPTMFARLHMLIILNNYLKLCLTILTIESVKQM